MDETFWDSRDPILLSMLTRALVTNGYFSYVEINQLRVDRRNDDPVDVLGDVWWDVVDGPSANDDLRKRC